MNGRKAKQARKLAQTPKPVKVPTPELSRSHSWKVRYNAKKARVEYRPGRFAIRNYGVRDLGWQRGEKYRTRAGHLTKAARA